MGWGAGWVWLWAGFQVGGGGLHQCRASPEGPLRQGATPAVVGRQVFLRGQSMRPRCKHVTHSLHSGRVIMKARIGEERGQRRPEPSENEG